VGVTVGEGPGELGDEPGGVTLGQGAALVEPGRQAPARDQVEGQPGAPAGLPSVHEADDVRVAEPEVGPHLALEAGPGRAGRLGREHLEGDLASAPRVAGPVDDPGPAAAELGRDLVGAQAVRHGRV